MTADQQIALALVVAPFIFFMVTLATVCWLERAR
jgi:hypothetical protein